MISDSMLRKAANRSYGIYADQLEQSYDPQNQHAFSPRFEKKIRRLKRRANHPALYHSLSRAASINPPLSIVNYDDDRRRPVANGRLMAWGELTYAKPLTEKQMEDYELKPAPANPDRVRPSITARLKDGARGQEPPKEPSQKRDHKNHEER